MKPALPLVIWFVVSALCSVFLMKIASLRVDPKFEPKFSFAFSSPVFSTETWKKRSPLNRSDALTTLVQGTGFSLMCAFSVYLYFRVSRDFNLGVTLQSYFALIPIYLFAQSLGFVLQFVFFITGFLYPLHFQLPYLSGNLPKFWGIRWALWVSDWMRQLVFSRYRHAPQLGLAISFLASGVWHEVLINLPLFLFYKKNLLGTMIPYFLLQSTCLSIDRSISHSEKFSRRTFL